MTAFASIKKWAPWVLVAALAFLWVRSEIGHRAVVKSLQVQVTALADARAKAADLQGQADVDAAVQAVKEAVQDEADRTDLGTYLRSLTGSGSNGPAPGPTPDD